MELLGNKPARLSIAGETLSALSNGFRILESIAVNGEGLTFSEIVSATGIPKATVHRLLRELVDLSAIAYDDSTRRYRGSLLLASLGASVMENYDLRRVVRPHLEALHEATGSVVTLGIRDGEQGIYVDKIEPADLVIRLHSEIGKSFPLHCTALGKVLLAFSDATTIGRITRRRLRAYTANTVTDGKALRQELNEVTRRGYAIDREEITRGLVCVAAPIYGLDGKVDAAVSCTVSSFDADDALLRRVTQQVVDCAQAASH
jgi:IclR family acetate operon transcriptional repressor